MAIIEEPPLPAPEWVLTYGDLMSLLLTFFVMIVAMSELKQDDKFQTVAMAMEQKFGRPSGNATLEERWLTRDAVIATRANAAFQTRQAAIPAAMNTSVSEVGLRQHTMQPVLGMVMFAENSLALSPESQSMLRTLFAKNHDSISTIELRGNAYLAPAPRTSYRDAHDLAYERTRVVARFLMEDLQIERQRIRLNCIQSEDFASERVEIVALAETAGASITRTAAKLENPTRR